MKLIPRRPTDHEKSTLESEEIQFRRKLIFAIPPLPNACFCNPRQPDLDPKTIRKKQPGNKREKYLFWSKNTQQAFKTGPLNQKNR